MDRSGISESIGIPGKYGIRTGSPASRVVRLGCGLERRTYRCKRSDEVSCRVYGVRVVAGIGHRAMDDENAD